MNRQAPCLWTMPFGQKPRPKIGGVLGFDQIYNDAI
jgi:hypothetical protein